MSAVDPDIDTVTAADDPLGELPPDLMPLAIATAVGPTIRLSLDLPIGLLERLSVRTTTLDTAETAALILHLYAESPLDRRATVLDGQQLGRICSALGRSPQGPEELTSAIEDAMSFSLAGVKMKWNAGEISILQARNATGMPPREWAAAVFEEMKQAWINGQI